MNIFRRKNTPTKRIPDIKKCVNKFDLTVKNFNSGPEITTVNVRIKRVITRYRDVVGNTIPLLNKPITKYSMKKYTNKDLINCFIFSSKNIKT